MIEIPVKGSELHEQLQGRFGRAGLEYILEMAHKLNELEKRLELPKVDLSGLGESGVTQDVFVPDPLYSVNPPELSDARIKT